MGLLVVVPSGVRLVIAKILKMNVSFSSTSVSRSSVVITVLLSGYRWARVVFSVAGETRATGRSLETA